MNDHERDWIRDYSLLALRVDRAMTHGSGGTVLIFTGPEEWRKQVAAEDPADPDRLIEEADRLLEGLPFDGSRNRYLTAHVRALRGAARALLPDPPHLAVTAGECLGMQIEPIPDAVFGEAHDALNAALPGAAGSLAERFQGWRDHHTLGPESADRLPGFVLHAIAETRARTRRFIDLPEDESVDCQIVRDAHFLAAGHHHGGRRSTIYINGSLPFNLADLLYVVAHEGHPGHIAESVLKDIHLVRQAGRTEQHVRFMLSPAFTLSEGLGLSAQSIVFPTDEARAWLDTHVLRMLGIPNDGSDFAAIHHVRNVLWGAWANAAFMLDEGRSDDEVAACLGRWALLDHTETRAALHVLHTTGMNIYVLSYYHGWQVVWRWLSAADRPARLRRLLTEPLLPADLVA